MAKATDDYPGSRDNFGRADVEGRDRWVRETDEGKLKEYLDTFGVEMELRRAAPSASKYSVTIAISSSIVIFGVMFSGLLLVPIEDLAAPAVQTITNTTSGNGENEPTPNPDGQSKPNPLAESAPASLLTTSLGEAGTDRIEFALIISSSGGVIPGIAYVILRDVEKEHRNQRLEALSLKMRYLRSKILSLKQEHVGDRG